MSDIERLENDLEKQLTTEQNLEHAMSQIQWYVKSHSSTGRHVRTIFRAGIVACAKDGSVPATITDDVDVMQTI